MAFASQVELYAGVNLDPLFQHSLTFTSLTNQRNYFNSKMVMRFTEFSYLRKESTIRVAVNIEQLEGNINYLGALNNSKWRYYFITNKTYINDTCTELSLTLDVLQTYLFDWNLPPCFVERRHTQDDTPGANMVDEGLEIGEYVSVNDNWVNLGEMCIIVQSSVTMQNPMGEPVSGVKFGNIYSGLKLYTRTLNDTGVLVLNAALSALSTAGKADGVQAMWMYPKKFINANWANENDEVMLEVTGITSSSLSYSMAYNLNGYQARNKKLYTYPYYFMHVHNNMGENAQYHYEHFANKADMKFQFSGSPANDACIRMLPLNYRGHEADNESGLTLSSFPSCPWTQDAYKIWMAQNANQQSIALESSKVSTGISIASQVGSAIANIYAKEYGQVANNVVQGINSGVSGYYSVQGIMAQQKDAQITPLQAKGTQSSCINVGLGYHTFTISNLSIRREQAERLDMFFDMYGYKTNRVEKPSITGRAIWNFVKTVGCVVLGDIDAADRAVIASIFDKGVTWWHNPETMYDYSLAASNTIVGLG